MRPLSAHRKLPALALVASAAAAALLALGGCQLKHNDANADLVQGKKLFVAKCGSCHTLARAGAKGTVGPNLDAAFEQSLRDGFKRNTIRGIVRAQIADPGRGAAMPADLVTGAKAEDVAAYVASVVDRPGQDTGLLASAVQAPGAGKPVVEVNGTLEVDADPGGQLAYVTNKATAEPGAVTLKMKNASSVPHNIAIEGNGVNAASPTVQGGAVAQLHASLEPGTYTYYCQVTGHRAAGMLGTLVVK
jgi:mono/diheme cytochrome c family protein